MEGFGVDVISLVVLLVVANGSLVGVVNREDEMVMNSVLTVLKNTISKGSTGKLTWVCSLLESLFECFEY